MSLRKSWISQQTSLKQILEGCSATGKSFYANTKNDIRVGDYSDFVGEDFLNIGFNLHKEVSSTIAFMAAFLPECTIGDRCMISMMMFPIYDEQGNEVPLDISAIKKLIGQQFFRDLYGKIPINFFQPSDIDATFKIFQLRNDENFPVSKEYLVAQCRRDEVVGHLLKIAGYNVQFMETSISEVKPLSSLNPLWRKAVRVPANMIIHEGVTNSGKTTCSDVSTEFASILDFEGYDDLFRQQDEFYNSITFGLIFAANVSVIHKYLGAKNSKFLHVDRSNMSVIIYKIIRDFINRVDSDENKFKACVRIALEAKKKLSIENFYRERGCEVTILMHYDHVEDAEERKYHFLKVQNGGKMYARLQQIGFKMYSEMLINYGFDVINKIC